jgi:hypothetical protein
MWMLHKTHIGKFGKERLATRTKMRNRGDPKMSAPRLAETCSCCAGPSAMRSPQYILGCNNHPSLSENGHREKELIGPKKVVEDIPI